MAEKKIGKVTTPGVGGVYVTGKTARADSGESGSSWWGQIKRYVFGQTGLSPEEQSKVDQAVSEYIKDRKGPKK